MKKSILFLLSLILVSCAAPKEVSQGTLITNVTVIDVESGAKLDNRNVALEGDRIVKIYDSNVTPTDSVKVIDGTGKFLIPGLSDMHTHYFWNYVVSNPLLIANGITHIREMWGEMNTINSIRQQTQSGQMLAPDVYSSGSIIDGTPPIWPTSTGVGSPEEAVKAVDGQIQSGVDFIKVYSRLPRETYLAIANHTKEKGIPFAGHIPSDVSIWEAMEAGQKSSEHLYRMLEVSNSDQVKMNELLQKSPFGMELTNFLVDHFNESRFDSLATVLAQSDMWLSPTLTVLRSIANLNNADYLNDERLQYLPQFMTASWDPTKDFRFRGRTQEFYAAGLKKYQLQLSLMGKLAQKGVKIIAGTDYPNPYCFPGFSLHDELQLMVEGGMTNLQALQAATINAAIFTGREDEFGSIQEGKLASLILLNEDPLENINNTRSIESVFLRGQYHDREALNRLLEQAKKTAGR